MIQNGVILMKILTLSSFGNVKPIRKNISVLGVWQCQTYGHIVDLVPPNTNQICKVIFVGLVPPNAIVTIKVERNYGK